MAEKQNYLAMLKAIQTDEQAQQFIASLEKKARMQARAFRVVTGIPEDIRFTPAPAEGDGSNRASFQFSDGERFSITVWDVPEDVENVYRDCAVTLQITEVRAFTSKAGRVGVSYSGKIISNDVAKDHFDANGPVKIVPLTSEVIESSSNKPIQVKLPLGSKG